MANCSAGGTEEAAVLAGMAEREVTSHYGETSRKPEGHCSGIFFLTGGQLAHGSVSQQLQLPEFSAMKRKLDLPPAPLAQVQAKEILRCSIGPCPKPRLGTKTHPRCSLLQPG